MSKLTSFLEMQIVDYKNTIDYCNRKIMAETDKRKRKEYEEVIAHAEMSIELNKANLAKLEKLS